MTANVHKPRSSPGERWSIAFSEDLPATVIRRADILDRSGAVRLDARWGHFGADHWVEGRPTEEGQGAALDLSAARRKPELFVAGECLAEGPRQTLQTVLHEAVHALAHVRGVKDTSRGGKYHNKREFVALAGERFKVACGCQPPRSFWIRVKQYAPGPITCGVCGQDFQPQDTASNRAGSHAGTPTQYQVA